MGEVGKMFFEQFGTNIILSSWVASGDRIMFRHIIEAAGIDPTCYDYHMLDLWPPAYMYLLKRGYEGSPRSEAMFTAFGLPARGNHDALDDCRYAATVLRIISSD